MADIKHFFRESARDMREYWTEEANQLSSEIFFALRPIFERVHNEGYSMIEAEYIASHAMFEMAASLRIGWGLEYMTKVRNGTVGDSGSVPDAGEAGQDTAPQSVG